MYREAAQILTSLPGYRVIVEISPGIRSPWIDMVSGRGNYYRTSSYPAYDVCDRPLAYPADLIILDNVLEHVIDPKTALANVHASLLPGGHVFIATPFLVRIHPAPVDLWRWTPQGLRRLLEEAGFEVKTLNSWGNAECVTASLTGWPIYEEGVHSLDNEPGLPVMVWALAQRASVSLQG